MLIKSTRPRTRQVKWFLPLAVALTLGALQPVALAQSGATLEEVIVTAQRRAESLQGVPLAITAISGDELSERGVADIKGITERTPGFTMGSFNAGQPQLYIRGIGSNADSPAADQSVIVFIDEVYVGRSAGMDLDLFDLERVEVLRGPQGTLFGKNVVGGAVSVVTTKPTEELDMRLEATLGDLNLLVFRGLVSGPLSERVFGKFSFSSRRRDGYIDSKIDRYPEFFPQMDKLNLGDIEQGNVNTDSFRGHLRFLPSDDLEINLTANLSKMNQNGPGRHYIGPDGVWFIAESALLPNYRRNIHTNLADDAGHSIIDIFGLTARVDYQAPSFTFTSLSSYRKVDANIDNLIFGSRELTNLRLSNGGGGLVAGSNPYTDESDTYTQEFRFASAGLGDWEWIAGLYFFKEETVRDERGHLGFFTSDGMGGSNTVFPIQDGGVIADNTTNSYAIFGQLTYSFTEQMRLTLGARQTREKKDVHSIGTPGTFAAARDYDLNLDESWSAFTPKATLDYQLSEDVFAYLSYSEGFKSGGFPGDGGTVLIASTGFDQEKAILYEFGVKSEWLDHRLRLNSAAFFTDYEDLQILQLLAPNDAPANDIGSLITQNAADAEIQGMEIEFTLLLSDELTLSGSYTYLSSEFSGFSVPTGFRTPGGGAAPADRTGNSLRNAPKNAFNVLLRYEHTLANSAGLRLQADFRHKDEVVQDPDEVAHAIVPAYDVVDLRATYTAPSDTWTITAWVKNAADEDYFLHNFPVQASGFATPALPRTYGITIGWRN